MKQPIVVGMLWAVLFAGAPIAAPGRRAQANKPQAEAGSPGEIPKRITNRARAEQDCIVRMLQASTLAEAKARKAACKNSFALRAYHASLLVELHAPGADEGILSNMPQNLVDLHAFHPNTFDKLSNSDYRLVGYAYERYYKSLFRIVAERPSLLPEFFPIADRFGAPSGDNVDETGWFCNALHDIEVKIPAAYWRAVRRTNNKEYRANARGCALNPIP